MDARQRINQRMKAKGRQGHGGGHGPGNSQAQRGGRRAEERGSGIKPRKINDLRQLIGETRPQAMSKVKDRKSSVRSRLGFTSKSKAARDKAAAAGGGQRGSREQGVGLRSDRLGDVRIGGGIPKVTIRTKRSLQDPTQTGLVSASASASGGSRREMETRSAIPRTVNQNRVWVRKDQEPSLVLPQVLVPQMYPQTSVPTVIFATPGSFGTSFGQPMDTSTSAATSKVDGNSVVVSNLNHDITQQDIMELFGDIGPMASYQMVNPTTALITYRINADASRAVENYHNRLLDGYPMQCTLIPSPPGSVQPSSASTQYIPSPIRGASSSSSFSTKRSPAVQSLASEGYHSRKWSNRETQFTVKI